MANVARCNVKRNTLRLASQLGVFFNASFLLLRFEAHNASAVRLHDEGTAMWLAVLELVRNLRLEVVDVIQLLRLKVPDIEDAGMLVCAKADRNEHLVALDAGSLPYVIGWETRVEVQNAVVVEGISGVEVNHGSLAELGHGEDHGSPTVALAHVLNGVAIAYQSVVLGIYHPLQGIAEESVRVVEHNGLHELGLSCKRDALHKADILHALVALFGTLGHIKQRKHVGLVVTLCTKEGHVGMILAGVACQRELAQHLKP